MKSGIQLLLVSIFIWGCQASESQVSINPSLKARIDQLYVAATDTLKNEEEKQLYIDSLELFILNLAKDSSVYATSLGYASYQRGKLCPSELDKKIYWYERSLQHFLAAEIPHDSLVLRLYSNLAEKYFEHEQQLYKSLIYAQEGIVYANSKPTFAKYYTELIYQLYLCAGRATQRIADPQSAVDYFEQARRLQHQQSVPYYMKGHLANEYSLALNDLGRLDLALSESHLAEALLRSEDILAQIDEQDLADVYNNRYSILDSLNLQDSAYLVLQKSREINDKYERVAQVADNDNNLGIYYWKNRQFSKALHAYQRAIYVNKSVSNRPFNLAQNYDNLADYFRDTNEPDSALYYYRQAISGFVKVPGGLQKVKDAAYKENLLPPLVSYSLLLTELNEEQPPKYPIDSINASFVALDQLLLAMRLETNPEASRLLQLDQLKNTLQQGIAFCYRAYQTQPKETYLKLGFRLMERSKNALSQDQLAQTQLYQSQLSKGSQDTLNALREQLAYYNQQALNENLSVEQRQDYQNKTRTAQTNRNAFEAHLREQYPNFGRYLQSRQVIKLADAQKMLAPDEVIIHFSVGKTNVYRMVIQRQHVSLEQLPMPYGELKELANRFVERVAPPAQGGIRGNIPAHNQQLLADGYQLYQVLFNGFEFPADTSKISLLTDDFLSLIPFDALTTAPADQLDPRDYPTHPYLIRQVQIRYLFSVAALVNQNQNTFRPRGVIMLAPDLGDKEVRIGNRSFPKISLEQEEEVLRSYYPRTEVISSIDTKQLGQLQAKLQQKLIVHFASHGYADSEAPDESYLVFVNSKGQVEPILSASWAQLSFNNSLTVLSACQTGKGKLVKGEGVFSLARLFLIAGSRSVISSRWNVGNEKIPIFFKDFYSFLQEGKLPKDEALREAKLSSIKEMNPPEEWANFFLLGDRSAIH